MSATLQCQQCKEEFRAKRSDAKWCSSCKEEKRRGIWRDYETRHKIACPNCGTLTGRRSNLCLVCENKSRGEKYAGHLNPNWKEGRTNAGGYTLVRVNHCSGKGAYRPEHHIVWEEANEKPLPEGWVIHHLNGIKNDNRKENLVAMPRSEHDPRLIVEPYEQRILELEKQVHTMQSFNGISE